MRTTITIDDHLLEDAKVAAARQRRTVSELIEDALRDSLAAAAQPRQPVVLPTFGDAAQRPLVDILDKEALADALGDNEWPRRDDVDS